MIKNDRQLLISQGELARFEEARAKLLASDSAHDQITKIRIDAIDSLVEELRTEINDYVALKSSGAKTFTIASLDELPITLIKARIAQNLTHRELAEQLGLKEQQIQRYETNDYSGASWDRMIEIARILNILLPSQSRNTPAVSQIKSNLEQAGITQDFILRSITPKPLIEKSSDEVFDPTTLAGLHTISCLSRIFGWSMIQLKDGDQLLSDTVSAARFKLPKRASVESYYIIYVSYLAETILAASVIEQRPLPSDPESFRSAMLSAYGKTDFTSCVRFVWDHGIPVIPLPDGGKFHGACIRRGGKNAIVLKQKSQSLSRWYFDLLHECAHTRHHMQDFNFETFDDAKATNQSNEEEVEANLFAGNVLLKNAAESLVQQIMAVSGGHIPRFKAAVSRVASKHDVEVDHLANYLAYRLSLQGINWWGAANNLQAEANPFDAVREILWEYIDLARLPDLDSQLVLQALSS
jgi:transcriptional regulator with XRE-family HTH domain